MSNLNTIFSECVCFIILKQVAIKLALHQSTQTKNPSLYTFVYIYFKENLFLRHEASATQII